MTEPREPRRFKRKRISKSIIVSFVVVVIIFFAILFGFSILLTRTNDLSQQNKDRIVDIQSSRVDSCKQTYESFHKVFKPFIPPPPRAKKQQEDLDKFNAIISKLKKGCTKQIKIVVPKEK